MIRSHVVVDGSNIATEGRTTPSLRQLDDAVKAFLDEHPIETLTVVVDATFPNRIDPSERPEYEEAILAGELVTPPAGAIGRGDAFILQIAEKVDATVLSNDSFQELHATHPWVFEDGRLIGGKPVPGVGWVFLLRTPVRGPVSRRATREAKGKGNDREPQSGRGRNQSQGREQGRRNTKSEPAKASPKENKGRTRSGDTGSSGNAGRGRTTRKPSEPLNDALPFIEFVAAHPVGSTLEGDVEVFSSHGAYVRAGGARCYVPMKLMGTPTPRAAREVMAIGERRLFAVHSIDAPHRGIDLAMVAAAPITPAPARDTDDGDTHSPAQQRGRRGGSRRKTAVSRESIDAGEGADAARTTPGVDALGTTYGAERHAEEAMVTPPAKKAPAKKRATKKTAAKKAPARKTAAKKAPARKTAAKKAPAKKAPAKKAPAKKTAAKKAPARKTAAKKAPPKTPPRRRPPRRPPPRRHRPRGRPPRRHRPARRPPRRPPPRRRPPRRHRPRSAPLAVEAVSRRSRRCPASSGAPSRPHRFRAEAEASVASEP